MLIEGINSEKRPQPVAVAEGGGLVISDGTKSDENSSVETLPANGAFEGVWLNNDDSHIGYNVVSDQTGTLYIDIGIETNQGVMVAFTRTVEVRALEFKFGTFVKMPGRWHRARYRNNETEQQIFGLHVATGNNLFPYSVSDDGEILTTVTERERGVYTGIRVDGVTSDTYRMLIDLSDLDTYPPTKPAASICRRFIFRPTATLPPRERSASGSFARSTELRPRSRLCKVSCSTMRAIGTSIEIGCSHPINSNSDSRTGCRAVLQCLSRP